jgi:hypothetical protein
MLKRHLTILGLAFALAGGMLMMPTPAAAQQGQDYYTYVSEWAVPRAQWAEFEKQQEASIPRMKKLVADGTIVAWGNIATRVHQEDGYTHADWFTATSRANLLKALEEAWTTATNSSFVAATKHYDLFLHTFAHGGKTVPSATGYLRVGFYHAKPGEADAVETLMTKDIKPFLDSAVASGTLLMYNLDEEDIHTSEPGGFNIALLFPDAAAMDKFFSDLAANQKANPAIGLALAGLTVNKDHRDGLDRVTAYQHQ